MMATDPPYGVEYEPEWRAHAGATRTRPSWGRSTMIIVPIGVRPGPASFRRCDLRVAPPRRTSRANSSATSNGRWIVPSRPVYATGDFGNSAIPARAMNRAKASREAVMDPRWKFTSSEPCQAPFGASLSRSAIPHHYIHGCRCARGGVPIRFLLQERFLLTPRRDKLTGST